MILGLLLLSVSLSADALFFGFAFGFAGTRVPALSRLTICAESFLYSGAAVLAGGALASAMPAAASGACGAALTAAVGAAMIMKALLPERSDKRRRGPVRRIAGMLSAPGSGDADLSGRIDMREAAVIGTALSVDSVGAGAGAALSGLGGAAVPLSVTLCQLLMLSLGLTAGRRARGLRRHAAAGFGAKLSSLAPGLLLCALAVVRFFVF